jgi:hypothetical protein
MKKVFLIFGLINSIFFAINAQHVVIEASKMNVLYIGVDNPIDIAMSNVASDKLKVSIDNEATLQKISDGHFNVRVSRPGQVTITVEANGQIAKKQFRAKMIPDPVPMISGVKSGQGIGGKSDLKNFIYAVGLLTKLENFDFDARCSIQSYILVIAPKKGEIFQANVTGPTFSEEIKKRLLTLEVDDMVSFLSIKARCPGDSAARDLGSLSYKMQ